MKLPQKLYCVFSKEAIDLMKGNRGKLSAQAGHAFLHAYWVSEERFPKAAEEYRHGERDQDSPQGAFKITLVVDTTAELLELMEEHKGVCGVALVTDSGKTVFEGPTTTCLGLGPLTAEKKSDKLKNLKVLI